MNIKLFLEITKEFFDQIYSQKLVHEDNNCETYYDEEKGFEE